jgi:hypothetical protein
LTDDLHNEEPAKSSRRKNKSVARRGVADQPRSRSRT